MFFLSLSLSLSLYTHTFTRRGTYIQYQENLGDAGTLSTVCAVVSTSASMGGGLGLAGDAGSMLEIVGRARQRYQAQNSQMQWLAKSAQPK